MKAFLRLAALGLGCYVTAVGAGPDVALEQRMQMLERRVEQLERRLGTGAGEKGVQAIAVDARYWLGTENPFAIQSVAPLKQGKLLLEDSISLRPKQFGLDSEGVFNPYHNPARFPVAALSLQGWLSIPAAGTYQIEFRASPPREVEGSGNVKLSVALYFAEAPVYSQAASMSLEKKTVPVELAAGLIPFRLELLAQSPGFGPSPVNSRVSIGVKAPGDIAASPLRRFLHERPDVPPGAASGL